LQARGLYHAAFTCHGGPRLITRAHTWDQQAARAFAAELLAPRADLVERWLPDAAPEEHQDLVAHLAREYEVDPRVVHLQLENAGISAEAE
jgi:Zn-dependent peptidase ImmA (M78 family)